MPRIFDTTTSSRSSSRKNIVTTRGELFETAWVRAARTRRRGVRTGTLVDLRDGKQPGVHHEACARVLSCSDTSSRSRSTSTRTCRRRNSPHMIFERWVSGSRWIPTTAARVVPRRRVHPSLALLGRRRTASRGRTGSGEVAAARHTTTIAAGEIPAGAVAAQRTTVVGSRDGHDVIRFTANWYCTTTSIPAWVSDRPEWRVRVRGTRRSTSTPVPDTARGFGPSRPRTPRIVRSTRPVVCAANPASSPRSICLRSPGRTSPRCGRRDDVSAIVTGAGSGIGEALRPADRGHGRVVILPTSTTRRSRPTRRHSRRAERRVSRSSSTSPTPKAYGSSRITLTGRARCTASHVAGISRPWRLHRASTSTSSEPRA